MASDPLTIRETQAIELRMLSFFDDVCRGADVEYCLAYGSALGAYRHGGFIPWDDDMDVYVKRSDYPRIVELLDKQGEGRYKVFQPCATEGYNHPYAKLVDCGTSFTESKNAAVNGLGVFIDLFPCDFYCSDGRAIRMRMKVVNLLNKLYCQLYVRSHEEDPALLRRMWRIASAARRPHKMHDVIERMIQRGAVESGGYMACPYDADYVIPSSWVFPAKQMKFEDREYPVPLLIESYLEEMYGSDYMIPVKSDNADHGVARVRVQTC